MKPHRGPQRYPALGHAVRHSDLQRMVCAAAGVRRVNIPLPSPLVMMNLPFFRLVELLGIHWSASADGAYVTWRDNRVDNGVSERELGVAFRPVEDAVRDTVAWLKTAGHLRS
jgi:dihydroflavonol-4-reductase